MVTFRTKSFYGLHNTADTYAIISKLEQLWNKSLPQRDTQMQRVEHAAKQSMAQPEKPYFIFGCKHPDFSRGGKKA